MGVEGILSPWYDNDIRFDLLTRWLSPCVGEQVLEVLENVEDTKGNSGEAGRLVVTNLRAIWQAKKFPKINLSIGYNPITSIGVKGPSQKAGGGSGGIGVESLHVLARTKSSRYEFIFTSLAPPKDHPRFFALIIGVHKAYVGSRLYREIKMRSSLVVHHKKLQMLPQEQICEQINGVWNLSSDQGNLGSFFITNVRLVWFAATNELFNASIPFLQIAQIKVRESKFGKALVIETTEFGGGYVLGFRVDPKEKLLGVLKSLLAIHESFLQHPLLGVHFNPEGDIGVDGGLGGGRLRTLGGVVDDIEEVEENPEIASDAFAMYFAEGGGNSGTGGLPDLEKVYGVAFEKPREGFSIQTLWQVIPNN